jgi:hypothetical protein
MEYYESVSRFGLLLESFEEGYKYKLLRQDKKSLKYSFENKSGQNVLVNIYAGEVNRYGESIRSIWDKDNLIGLDFTVPESGKHDDLTGSGDAIKVIKTVYDILNDFVNKYMQKNNETKFSCIITFLGQAKKDEQGKAETQRSRLYKKVFQKIGKKEFPGLEIKSDRSYIIIGYNLQDSIL